MQFLYRRGRCLFGAWTALMRTADDLRLPGVLEELTRLPTGLVLITGATGMGKTPS